MPGKIRVVLNSNEKEKHAKRMRNARKEWSSEQKEKNRELSKLRMKAYRERKKEKQYKTDDSHKKATWHGQKLREDKNRKLAEYRRKYRANLSSQKKRGIREKDAARKREKRLRNKKASTQPQTEINSLSGQSQCATVSALKKAVYRAKNRLPKSPQKFEEVVAGIVTDATPKKRQALMMKGLDSMEAQKDLNDVLQSIKEVDQGMRGRDKVSRMKHKSFIGSLSTVVKKRRGMHTAVSAALGIHRKYFSHGSIRQPQKRKDCISKETEESIQNFFCKDNVSINLPNKKYDNNYFT